MPRGEEWEGGTTLLGQLAACPICEKGIIIATDKGCCALSMK